MRYHFTLIIISISNLLFAQANFSSPESVEYDAAHKRWLVGNKGTGEIVSYDPQSNLTVYFASVNSTGPNGIEILGNTAYVCDGASVLGFDLNTGAEVFNLNLGASFLNGLTTDGVANLFATDFTDKKIYRVTPASNSFNIMASTTKSPNGICYDGANNRCVIVTWGSNAPILGMSLLDSTVTTLLATSLNNCDGVTHDNAGYWYITTWGGNALRMVDPLFSAAPVSVMTGLSQPADIGINAAGDSIGIPNSSANTSNVVFYTNIATNIHSVDKDVSINLFPNPGNESISIQLPENVSDANAILFDLNGKEVLQQSFSGFFFEMKIADLPAGNYFLKIVDANGLVVHSCKVGVN